MEIKSQYKILLVVDNFQENKQKPSETGDFHSLPVHKGFMSLLNIALQTNSTGRSTKDRVEINDGNYATGCQRSPGKYKEIVRKLRFP